VSDSAVSESSAGADTTTDVLVVGAGPCGVVLASLLGVYGVRAIVIDRELDVLDYPRAVGIDDESLRTCQSIGLVDQVLADTLQNMPIRYYTSWGRCFAEVKPSVQPFGWPRRNLFLQPLLERTVRSGLARFDSIEQRLGSELINLVTDGDGVGVSATIRDGSGACSVVRASYVVGADGGRSTVRDCIGVTLDGTTEATKWLVVDVANDLLDAPYSAVFCNPHSPVLMVPLPYGHRRFEFRLGPTDDEDAVVQPDHVQALLAGRYGQTPLPDVVRARVYLHHSRVASAFAVGRVLLVGDAAHLQPPFFGQGMNSGLRDVTNLAWKLAAAVRGVASPELLETYDSERRPHAAAMVGFATRMGAMYRPRNAFTERFRDLVFRAVQRMPGGRDYVLQMKYKPMPRYTVGAITGVDAESKIDPVGRMFPQPFVGTATGRVRLDDALGPWFALVVFDQGKLDADSMSWWQSIGARVVHVVHDVSGSSATDEVADLDGALAAWRAARPTVDVVVVRPDRYVAAAVKRVDFASATSALRASFGLVAGT
jgi:3-(3-hydroxy-phenyl)propionate hydroxylase